MVEKTYEVTINVEVDDEGRMEVICPFCKTVFKEKAEIVDKLGEDPEVKTQCSNCGRGLNKVDLPEKYIKQIFKKIEEDAIEDITKELKKVFDKLELKITLKF